MLNEKQIRNNKNDLSQNKIFEELKEKIPVWVRNGLNYETVVKAEDIAKFLVKNDLTTSQIRSIFAEMRRIQIKGYINEKTAFLLLKPKLAYAVKRNYNEGIMTFYKIFCLGYDEVVKEENEESKFSKSNQKFNNFINFLEAILAYHKYHEKSN